MSISSHVRLKPNFTAIFLVWNFLRGLSFLYLQCLCKDFRGFLLWIVFEDTSVVASCGSNPPLLCDRQIRFRTEISGFCKETERSRIIPKKLECLGSLILRYFLNRKTLEISHLSDSIDQTWFSFRVLSRPWHYFLFYLKSKFVCYAYSISTRKFLFRMSYQGVSQRMQNFRRILVYFEERKEVIG